MHLKNISIVSGLGNTQNFCFKRYLVFNTSYFIPLVSYSLFWFHWGIVIWYPGRLVVVEGCCVSDWLLLCLMAPEHVVFGTGTLEGSEQFHCPCLVALQPWPSVTWTTMNVVENVKLLSDDDVSSWCAPWLRETMQLCYTVNKVYTLYHDCTLKWYEVLS